MESKRKNWISISLIIFLSGLLNLSCKKGDIPLIKTAEIKEITDVTALSGGTLSSDGGFIIRTCGVCWSIDSADLNIETAKHSHDSIAAGIFSSTINNLTPNTKYYIRAYAKNKAGTGYGQIISLTTMIYVSEITFNPTINYGSLVDQDGNIYKTVNIGSQVWMAENLKAITFKNGKPIDGYRYSNYTGSYLWYNNDLKNKATIGVLYELPVFFNSSNLCPTGWHIPTINEWEVLVNYLGGWSIAGGKLKEAGTSHWAAPNNGATNETGFTALPGGTYSQGKFVNMGYLCFYGSPGIKIEREGLAGSYLTAEGVLLRWDWEKWATFQGPDPPYYLSVRCIKD